MDPSCAFCSGKQLRQTFTLPDASNRPLQIWQCQSCYCHIPETAFDRAKPVTEPEQVRYHEALWSQSPDQELEKLAKDLRQMVQQMAPLLGPATPGRKIVELGCGRGALLKALLDCDYDAMGCEPSADLVSRAHSFYHLDRTALSQQTANSLLDQLATSGMRPSVFILWHVLEHICDPLPLVRRCIELMPDDGRLILQLPLLAQPYLVPEHYFFFTEETLNVLSDHLKQLPCRSSIDTENCFLNVYIGAPFAEMDAPSLMTEKLESTASTALAEPIITRDEIIADLRRKIARQSGSVKQELSFRGRLQKHPAFRRLLRKIGIAINDSK